MPSSIRTPPRTNMMIDAASPLATLRPGSHFTFRRDWDSAVPILFSSLGDRIHTAVAPMVRIISLRSAGCQAVTHVDAASRSGDAKRAIVM